MKYPNPNDIAVIMECGILDAQVPQATPLAPIKPTLGGDVTPQPAQTGPSPDNQAAAPKAGHAAQEASEVSAFAALLDWATVNNCPPEICAAAKAALATEKQEAIPATAPVAPTTASNPEQPVAPDDPSDTPEAIAMSVW